MKPITATVLYVLIVVAVGVLLAIGTRCIHGTLVSTPCKK